LYAGRKNNQQKNTTTTNNLLQLVVILKLHLIQFEAAKWSPVA